MNSQRDLPLQNFKPTVQVYAITNEVTGEYELMGHGFLQITTDQFEDESVHYIEVLKKTEGILLRSRMRLPNNFERQKGTVITWRDSEQRLHQELAISFEEEKEAEFFWRLICEKIGQNYLDINGRDVLEMPTENNLTAILEKTKSSKDMVEYHLLNSPDFINALHRVFCKFQARPDKMGMGMVGRILRSILTNLDHRLVENMFSDPSFELILEVEKFNRAIDLPRAWSERVRIKEILPLSADLNKKIQIIHRIAFYRQNILDLMKETYFEHILVLTQTECSKDIVNQFIREPLFEQLVEMPALPPALTPASAVRPKDAPDEETGTTEAEVVRRRLLQQAKLNFLMEAILTTKQVQSENLKTRFLDRLYKSDVLKMVVAILDQNIPRALDFLNCLVQASPTKFLQYLKEKYRESPSDNLHSKLAKKYCLGTEQLQGSILQILKSLGECFKAKQNLDFFTGTFFTYVFQCCKDERALLVLLSELPNVIDNVESFFGQAVKSKVLGKVLPFLRNLTRDKISELRAIKVLKRVLVQNSTNREFKVVFLRQVNGEVIGSGFFEYCMMLLSKNIALNNVISSSMLENLKLITSIKHYTPYHQFLQLNYANAEHLHKYIAKILTAKPETAEGEAATLPQSHLRELEEERQESYLLEDNNDAPIVREMDAVTISQLAELKRIRQEIEEEQEQLNSVQQIRKKRKENESPAMCIEFTLQFDESLEGIE